MKFDITALGEILIDFSPIGKDESGDPAFARKAGGAPLNLLATIAKYGGRTAFIGKVGNDTFGDYLRDLLKKYNINDSGLITDNEHNTTLAFVYLDENGERDFSFYRNFGADVFITPEDINPEIIQSSRIFHFGSLSLTSEPAKSATEYALDIARSSKAVITYDPNYRAPLWNDEDTAIKAMGKYMRYVDIIKLSKEEAYMMTGLHQREAAAELLFKQGRKIVLITDGANGVVYYGAGELGFVPSLDVTPIDTTGAGDIFFGTFLSEFIKSSKTVDKLSFEDITEFVKKAVKVSGESTLKKGAIASIP